MTNIQTVLKRRDYLRLQIMAFKGSRSDLQETIRNELRRHLTELRAARTQFDRDIQTKALVAFQV